MHFVSIPVVLFKSNFSPESQDYVRRCAIGFFGSATNRIASLRQSLTDPSIVPYVLESLGNLSTDSTDVETWDKIRNWWSVLVTLSDKPWSIDMLLQCGVETLLYNIK